MRLKVWSLLMVTSLMIEQASKASADKIEQRLAKIFELLEEPLRAYKAVTADRNPPESLSKDETFNGLLDDLADLRYEHAQLVTQQLIPNVFRIPASMAEAWQWYWTSCRKKGQVTHLAPRNKKIDRIAAASRGVMTVDGSFPKLVVTTRTDVQETAAAPSPKDRPLRVRTLSPDPPGQRSARLFAPVFVDTRKPSGQMPSVAESSTMAVQRSSNRAPLNSAGDGDLPSSDTQNSTTVRKRRRGASTASDPVEEFESQEPPKRVKPSESQEDPIQDFSPSPHDLA